MESYTADGVTFNMAYVPGGKTFPTGIDDSGSATIPGAYWICETEVTYELWGKVKDWAVNNEYTFANGGSKGNDNDLTKSDQHPVTKINWRSAMAWCNALTEWYNAQIGTNYECVYYSNSSCTNILRIVNDTDSVSASAGSHDHPYIKEDAKGFRLLTINEWEFAARWRNDATNTVSAYTDPYFTQGDSASGATADCSDASATGLVAWYSDNSDSSTHEVKFKNANTLGLYDMSGNVAEWCFDWHTTDSLRSLRGFSWFHDANILVMALVGSANPYSENGTIGFRFSRTE